MKEGRVGGVWECGQWLDLQRVGRRRTGVGREYVRSCSRSCTGFERDARLARSFSRRVRRAESVLSLPSAMIGRRMGSGEVLPLR